MREKDKRYLEILRLVKNLKKSIEVISAEVDRLTSFYEESLDGMSGYITLAEIIMIALEEEGVLSEEDIYRARQILKEREKMSEDEARHNAKKAKLCLIKDNFDK